ncbi:choline O-acetyltransferase-like isoform X1 [Culicoides brevitarsis]|uniref:choline O-acetyltransferase-like isoform X1 n=1 Tax=Culicoides brevitarsis TaxID=469753 RepID=UPI00307B12FB
MNLPKKWLSQSGATDDFGFPENLPKLPVPDMEETLTEYLRILEPITTKQQYERTKAITKNFAAGIGPQLHQFLEEKREAEDNWAYTYWLNDMYMDNPLPLPINSNPGMVLPPRKFTTVYDLSRFAARIVDAIVEHKEMLDSGKLPIERCASREKGQPMCMAQFYRLLGSCRQPGIPRDTQHLPNSQFNTSDDEHIIVMYRNQMYCLPVKAADRGRLSEDEINSQLLYILNDAPLLPQQGEPGAPPMIGILTTQSRPVWAKDRNTLLSMGENNQLNVELIEKALILLCIDESLPLTFNCRGFHGSPSSQHYAGGRDETNMAHQMIHGGGSNVNTANRWFDKTLEIVICTDGTWGLCYEHSPSEGLAPVQLLENILKKIDAMPPVEEGSPQDHLPPPERLEWKVNAELKQRIAAASVAIDKSIEDLDFYVYRYKGYGKNFIKSCQTSPDVFVQLALQLAYFKLYGFLVSTYESASTRRYLLGRVDCIRSASSEALEWAKAINQDEAPNVPLESDHEDDMMRETKRVHFTIYTKDHVRELFRCAAARQTEIMIKNIMGRGVDIPLLGYREASKELEGRVHEMFTDESYKIANCFLLSTSQVACSTNSFMGYGPVTPRGYGCSYNIHQNEIIFCISSFYSADNTSSSRFAKSLQESLDMMKDLLANN